MPATDKAIKEAELLRSKREASKIVGNEKAAEAVEKLKEATLTFSKKASKTGTLFSSVSKSEIAEQLSKMSGFEVEEDMIDLGEHGEHIKRVGEHMIKLNLTRDKSVEIKVIVNSNK